MRIIIKLNTEEDILDFVNITRSYKSSIDLIKYHHCVDAKSIMGVMALGIYDKVEVELISANEDELLKFSKDMRRFAI